MRKVLLLGLISLFISAVIKAPNFNSWYKVGVKREEVRQAEGSLSEAAKRECEGFFFVVRNESCCRQAAPEDVNISFSESHYPE